MIFNSIAVERRNNYKMIDLYTGYDGQDEATWKTWKRATIRIVQESNEKLWEENPCLSESSEVFLANWEEELYNISKGEP